MKPVKVRPELLERIITYNKAVAANTEKAEMI